MVNYDSEESRARHKKQALENALSEELSRIDVNPLALALTEAELLESILALSEPWEHKGLIYGYEFAKFGHKGQSRETGEPTIMHPLRVTYHLAKAGADFATKVAGECHDLKEDAGFSIDSLDCIFRRFDTDISLLVNGVSKPDGYTKKEFTQYVITNAQHDVRVYALKLADRIDNNMTMAHYDDGKRQAFLEVNQELLNAYKRVVAREFDSIHRLYMDLARLTIPAYTKSAEFKALASNNPSKP